MVVPFGLVERMTEEGVIFRRYRGSQVTELRENTPGVIYREDLFSQSMAKVRGVVSWVDDTRGELQLQESEIDDNWDLSVPVYEIGSPIYQAFPTSFDVDWFGWVATAAEQENLKAFAEELQRDSGHPSSGAILVPRDDDVDEHDTLVDY